LRKWDLADAFSHPKPVRLLQYLLEMASEPDATVMDFFAGSGSLAEAVMRLNHEQGHRRRCLLVSNNENQSLDKILLPRIEKMMKAYPDNNWEFIF